MEESSHGEQFRDPVRASETEACLAETAIVGPDIELESGSRTVLIDPVVAANLRERRRLREQNQAQRIHPSAQPSSRSHRY